MSFSLQVHIHSIFLLPSCLTLLSFLTSCLPHIQSSSYPVSLTFNLPPPILSPSHSIFLLPFCLTPPFLPPILSTPPFLPHIQAEKFTFEDIEATANPRATTSCLYPAPVACRTVKRWDRRVRRAGSSLEDNTTTGREVPEGCEGLRGRLWMVVPS